MPMIEFMTAFSKRRYLKKRVRLELRSDDDRPRIYCDDPATVARFFSEARQEARRRWPCTRALLRGQTKNYPGMVPALFRRDETLDPALRSAEMQLQKLVRSVLSRNARFARFDLAALLQHYGVNTSWLDVVDDLRIAVWFATHDLKDGSVQPRRQDSDSGCSGWIFMLSTRSDAGCLDVVDLREAHHGLSLRPHVQQAWSLRGSGRDLNAHVIATVEFPIDDDRWRLCGHMATANYLFPPATRDDTLKRLRRRQVTEALRQADGDNGLKLGSLGNISVWC